MPKSCDCPRSSARTCPVLCAEMRAACGRYSPIWSVTPSNLRRAARLPFASRRKRRVKRRWSYGWRLRTPASAFRRRPVRVCSSPSRKWTPPLRENTVAPGLGWPSASNSSTSWAVKSVATASPAKDRPFGSPFSLRKRASRHQPGTLPSFLSSLSGRRFLPRHRCPKTIANTYAFSSRRTMPSTRRLCSASCEKWDLASTWWPTASRRWKLSAESPMPWY